MNFWIAVAFFCINDSCAFWKADENFYSQEKCEAKVMEIINAVEKNKGVADGVCLPIKPGQT
jgi:hypothetical protein